MQRYTAFMRKFENALPPAWPAVTWVEGAGCNGGQIGGCNGALYQRHQSRHNIFSAQGLSGALYEDAFCRYCLLGGIHSNGRTVLPGQQSRF